MVEPITDVEDLRRHLQWAVEVEHATIPPYEYAMWSIVDRESAAATSIKYVVREEMLHAALAANLLTAVGGRPRFTGEQSRLGFRATLLASPVQSLVGLPSRREPSKPRFVFLSRRPAFNSTDLKGEAPNARINPRRA